MDLAVHSGLAEHSVFNQRRNLAPFSATITSLSRLEVKYKWLWKRTYLPPEDPQCSRDYDGRRYQHVQNECPGYHGIFHISRRFVHDVTVHGFHAQALGRRPVHDDIYP